MSECSVVLLSCRVKRGQSGDDAGGSHVRRGSGLVLVVREVTLWGGNPRIDRAKFLGVLPEPVRSALLSAVQEIDPDALESLDVRRAGLHAEDGNYV
jgi:hypothetical protein